MEINPEDMTEEELKPFELAFSRKRADRHREEAAIRRKRAYEQEAALVHNAAVEGAKEAGVSVDMFIKVRDIVQSQMDYYEYPWA